MTNLKHALSLAVRKTKFGNYPDPVAQDILKSSSFSLLEQEIDSLGLPDFIPLAGGTFHMVLQCEEHVLRIDFGKLFNIPNIPQILQPIIQNEVGNLKYQLLPMADTKSVTEEHLATIMLELKDYRWHDSGVDNIGIYRGKPVIIDAENITKKLILKI
jgi:hypothetical protein